MGFTARGGSSPVERTRGARLVGARRISAQAIAIIIVTPLNFLGIKLWSFGRWTRAQSAASGLSTESAKKAAAAS